MYEPIPNYLLRARQSGLNLVSSATRNYRFSPRRDILYELCARACPLHAIWRIRLVVYGARLESVLV